MAEIGLVQFACVAREVDEAALPRYRSPFSKHTFTHPTRLAIQCLMRYEDWAHREVEVRLQEHTELCTTVHRTGRQAGARLHDHVLLYAPDGRGQADAALARDDSPDATAS